MNHDPNLQNSLVEPHPSAPMVMPFPLTSAGKAFDTLLSVSLLKFVDSPPLRQNVQWALNRGRNYHPLRRTITYANSGKLRYPTKEEQQLWSKCSRVLANCIIQRGDLVVCAGGAASGQ